MAGTYINPHFGDKNSINENCERTDQCNGNYFSYLHGIPYIDGSLSDMRSVDKHDLIWNSSPRHEDFTSTTVGGI